VFFLIDVDAEGGVTPVSPQADTPVAGPSRRSVYQALVLGTRDYVRKNGFQARGARPVGRHRFGADAGVAVDALGAERVEAVMMPSRYTADISNDRCRAHGRQALGVRYHVQPIEPDGRMLHETRWPPSFAGLPPDAHRGKHPGALRAASC
jgi:NAD+ synthase (glutamine-hydrolysing)